jgi:transposase
MAFPALSLEGMFIREIIKKNPGSDQLFVYHRLMEAVRTTHGPRQRILLNLGRLDLPREDWKLLANRIEDLYLGQQAFGMPPEPVEQLAQHYARLLRQREMQRAVVLEKSEAEWETVDLQSLTSGECRTLGGEAVALKAFRQLGLPQMLSDLGLSPAQVQEAALLIIGRLLHPASERDTALWAKEISALGELLSTDFQRLSNNSLYRLSDQLVAHRSEIEGRLAQREKAIFSLEEKIILYDLTNTYLTGQAGESSLARRGRCKQKRRDCPLLTLALVLDEDGFPKASRVFPGNVGEPGTLKEMLQALLSTRSQPFPLLKIKPTVVLDAGVATADNLALIQESDCHYVAVARQRPQEIPAAGLLVIKEDKSNMVQVKRLDQEGEVLLYCHSTGRARKEQSMQTRMQQRFEEGLQNLAASLSKPRGRKRYDKVVERLGRLKEKYPSVAQFYRIEVQQQAGQVRQLVWAVEAPEKLQARFAGTYYLRSDRRDLDDKTLWSLYMMLTQLEDAFRSLKSELGLRPVYHRHDRRLEGHLFISVLAYHLLATIRRDLKKKGIHYRWQNLRRRLSTQMRVTVSVTNDRGERIYLRQTTDPEPFHLEIYRALGLPPKPLTTKRFQTQQDVVPINFRK